MPMTVPDCDEWRCQPTFSLADCCCVRSCHKPWPDCTACKGSGKTGTVSIGVWEAARAAKKMPDYQGDPRFDVRARLSEWEVRLMKEFERRKSEGRLKKICRWLFG